MQDYVKINNGGKQKRNEKCNIGGPEEIKAVMVVVEGISCFDELQ